MEQGLLGVANRAVLSLAEVDSQLQAALTSGTSDVEVSAADDHSLFGSGGGAKGRQLLEMSIEAGRHAALVRQAAGAIRGRALAVDAFARQVGVAL